MKNKSIFLSFSFVFFNFHPFEAEVKNAVKELKTEKATILDIKNTSATEGSEALAIVFPEMIRWSAFQDLMETAADELLYVNKGHTAGNISIGHFQMQPLFVEQLETYIGQIRMLAPLIISLSRQKTKKKREKNALDA